MIEADIEDMVNAPGKEDSFALRQTIWFHDEGYFTFAVNVFLVEVS